MRSDPMSRATRPTEPVIAMIWAQTPERVIGRDGTMPCTSPRTSPTSGPTRTATP